MSSNKVTQEKAKLNRVLGRFDLVFFTACALVALDTVSLITGTGGQAVIWLGLTVLFFLVPYGMITGELGTTFSVEGGPYAWIRASYGRFVASIAAFVYWVGTPVWLAGILTATVVATLNSFVLDTPLGTVGSIVVGLAFVWLCVLAAALPLKWGKWIPNLGTIVKILSVAMFAALVVAYLAENGRRPDTLTLSGMQPSISGFLAVVGILAFTMVGYELSTNAGDEMQNPRRDVPVMVLLSGTITAVLYAVVIVGILLVLPGDQLSNVAGFTDAYAVVATVLGDAAAPMGYLFAALIVLSFLGSGAVWTEAPNRAQAVAALDGAGPLWLARLNRGGAPSSANLAVGVVGSVFVVAVFTLADGSLASFFAVMLALVVSLTTGFYMIVFPTLLVLRRKYPHVGRPYSVPGGSVGAWLAVVSAEFFVTLATVSVLWPGALDRLLGQGFSIVDYWGVSRLYFETVTLGTLAVIILIGVAYWWVGRRNLRRGLVRDVDLFGSADPGPAADPRAVPKGAPAA